MTEYTKGTVLTCAHADCNCRVVIEAECHCTDAASTSTYMCACGTPLLPVGKSPQT
jgi:metallothionein